MRKIIYTLLSLTTGFALTSCSKDFTETQFHQGEQMAPLSSVEQLTSFVNGTYVKMRDVNYLGTYYRAYGEVRSDEMYNTEKTGRLLGVSTYTMKTTEQEAESTWKAIYRVIGNANIAINAADNLTWGGSNDPVETANEIKRLKGQAYTIRALALFDLLRLYGQQYAGGTLGVPIPLQYDPNASSTRATVAQTEAQIESDLNRANALFEAIGDVVEQTSSSEKNYISPLALKAIASRYYLYKGDYAKVAELSEEIISSGKYAVAAKDDLQGTFSKPDAENSVFELTVGTTSSLSSDSYDFLVHYSPGYAQLAVSEQAVNLYEAGDVRKNLITSGRLGGQTKYFLNNKFYGTQGSNNIKVIRYEEVLLNAIEAHLNTDDPAGTGHKTKRYYNTLRHERGLSDVSAVTLDDLKKERVRELVGEGQRYWDLLRWGAAIPQLNSAGNVVRSRNIGDKLLAFPIPKSEVDSPNSGGVSQNEGY
ncbi:MULTISPECIES: RagB/SusD family nutrient uptake outer membrane protein [Capnocytophaga]|uniref:RagB/SusD family nutrient uptake outer membrane protein n=1 Tax=Capnocytophaga TaxID=1016 RepID=UPI00027C6536|nr:MULTISPECIES: RagB/SusD family nutrient uptake outer membrane protein [Capnocytophaga]EJU31202.1 starch-binding protein, SusD-like family [Capnocytophaga sp. CM59]